MPDSRSWDSIKDEVCALIRDRIRCGGAGAHEAIHLDLVSCNFKLPAGVHLDQHLEVFDAYYKAAEKVVVNWDIRMVGKLRELFPGVFRGALGSRPLKCEYNDRGAWMVYAVKPEVQ